MRGFLFNYSNVNRIEIPKELKIQVVANLL